MTGAVLGVLAVLLPVTAAAFGAAALRLPSATAFVLAWYLLLSAFVLLAVELLSLAHGVDRAELAASGLAALVVGVAAWRTTGRPAFPRVALPRNVVRREPVVAALAAVVALAVAYEALLLVVAAPNTWDSLTYHLARVASWYQEGGVHWIPDATGRQNEFPPGAEILVLFTVVAWGGDRLVEAPQLLAELVLVAAAYGIGRRLGFRPAASLFAALLVPTLAEVALQSTTTQTDLLVAASLAAAVYFILGGTGRELALAGLGLGLAAATKQTIVFALPGLLLLAAVTLDRRGLLRLGAWTAGGLVLLAFWGPVRNLVETGHLLGEGSGRVEHQADPDVRALATVVRVGYRILDLSGWTAALELGLGLTAAAAAVVLGLRALRRGGARLAPVVAVLVLAGPLVVAVTAGAIGAAAERLNVPINPPETTSGPFSWHVNRRAHEDFAYFGPLVALVLLPVCAVCAFCGLRGGGDRRRAALALGLPLFVVTMSLTYKYNPFLGRFLVIPVVLSLPLVAVVLRYRAAAAGVAALAAASLVVVHAHNELKPFGDDPIWTLDRAATFALNAEGSGRPWRRSRRGCPRTARSERSSESTTPRIRSSGRTSAVACGTCRTTTHCVQPSGSGSRPS